MCECLFSTAVEWVGKKEGNRNVRVMFESSRRHIIVQGEDGNNLRAIDLTFLTLPDRGGRNYVVRVFLSPDAQMRMIRIRVPKEYDLVCCACWDLSSALLLPVRNKEGLCTVGPIKIEYQTWIPNEQFHWSLFYLNC